MTACLAADPPERVTNGRPVGQATTSWWRTPFGTGQSVSNQVDPVEDDGTLDARWFDDRGLVDAILARSPLDPMQANALESPDAQELPKTLAALAGVLAIGTNQLAQILSTTLFPAALTTQRPAALATRQANTDPSISEHGTKTTNITESNVASTNAPSPAEPREPSTNAANTTEPIIGELSDVVAAFAAVRAQRNALEVAEALLLDQARRVGFAAQSQFTDAVRLTGWSKDQRVEVVQRAIVSDLALAVHDSHDGVAARMNQGQALLSRAPKTLAKAVCGQISWRNAAYLADRLADLDAATARQVDAAAANAAATNTPARFRSRLRRIIEDVHPTPIEVRHSEAAAKRYITTAAAADGMGYLTLFAPEVAVHAIWDRLVQTARLARTKGDARTQTQLRTDVAIALLLDDSHLNDIGPSNPDPNVGYDSPDTDSADTEPGGPALDLAKSDPDGPISGGQLLSGAFPASGYSRGANRPGECSTGAYLPGGYPAPEHPGSGFSLARLARSVRPRVFVTVPVLTLLGACDAPALLDGTVPIDAETARELAGMASSFTRILTNPYHGDVLGVDAKTYRPPAGLRSWIQLRDGTCRFPGCMRRAVESDLDHGREWSKGGTTTANNLTALCRRHHTLKTLGAYTSTIRDGDVISTWIGPTGRQYTSYPDLPPATIHGPKQPLPTAPKPPRAAYPDDDPPPF